ncbi:tetratricopeptide repeat protein, partial [Thermodesulfobacteriota bacterium]
MNRSITLLAIFCLVCAFSTATAVAQSKADGMKLIREAAQLRKSATNYRQMQMAERKYIEALRIFRKVGDRPGIAWALHDLGWVYTDWAEYNKALEYYRQALTEYRYLKVLLTQPRSRESRMGD